MRDIFGIWANIGQMADSLSKKYDTVLAWRIRGRIPEDAWEEVIAAAAQRGTTLTAAQLLELNAPMKKRGKPPQKPVKRRRSEARAV